MVGTAKLHSVGVDFETGMGEAMASLVDPIARGTLRNDWAIFDPRTTIHVL